LVDNFFVGQVVCLLKNQSTKCRVQSFCRAAETIIEERAYFPYGKFAKEFFLK